MARSFNEMMQEYVNLSYEELLAFARRSLADFSGELESIVGEDNTASTLAFTTLACLGVDASLTDLECKFICELMGTDYTRSDLLSLVASINQQKAEEMADLVADRMSNTAKSAFVLFCMAFLAVDERFSREEVAFVKRLID